MKDAVSHVYERVLHSLSRAHARGEDFQITKNDGGPPRETLEQQNTTSAIAHLSLVCIVSIIATILVLSSSGKEFNSCGSMIYYIECSAPL